MPTKGLLFKEVHEIPLEGAQKRVCSTEKWGGMDESYIKVDRMVNKFSSRYVRYGLYMAEAKVD